MPTLIAIAAVLTAVGLHFWWKSRLGDLLARKEAVIDHLKQQQRETEARLLAQQQALFNSMLEGVLILDHTGRIQLANQALLQLTGLATDPRGLTLLEAFRQHDLAQLADRLVSERQVLDVAWSPHGLTGRSFRINATLLLDGEGRPDGALFVFHDLTRLKALEATRQEFVANVSHELRTPLSLIKGFVETLLDGAKDDPATATRFLQTIKRHSDRLAFLIEDLLTISKLESGQMQMNRQAFAVATVAARVLESLQARADERRIRLVAQVADSLQAHADPERLEQVLWNLVENAIKYGREGGAVTVRGAPAAPGWIEVAVQDDGPGIPREAQARVFERFYRVDKARAREQGGTGLGLAIVKHIVQAHGGQVRIESAPGQGATFLFTLPAE